MSRSALKPQPVKLSEMARDIADDLARHEERQVAFDIEEGLSAEADPRLMTAVLENLLRNAWKYSARRSDARIQFGQLPGATPPTFFVRDNGEGFDMAHAGHLFQPFSRLHGSGEFEGTGIGLAPVQKIVGRRASVGRGGAGTRRDVLFYADGGLEAPKPIRAAPLNPSGR